MNQICTGSVNITHSVCIITYKYIHVLIYVCMCNCVRCTCIHVLYMNESTVCTCTCIYIVHDLSMHTMYSMLLTYYISCTMYNIESLIACMAECTPINIIWLPMASSHYWSTSQLATPIPKGCNIRLSNPPDFSGIFPTLTQIPVSWRT